MLPTELLRTSAAELDLALDDTSLAPLARYVELLANAPLNVTGTREPGELWRSHVRDALTLLPLLPPGAARLVDVGSGGGLPGVPLAIARPDLEVVLLEATARKAAFLEAVAERLELRRVRVVAARAEEAGHDPALRGRFDVATCRAVGPLREIAEYALPLLAAGGVLLAPKGEHALDEVEAAEQALATLGGGAPEVRPTGHGDRSVVVVPLLRPTPDAWPRRPGRPRKAPL